MVLKQFTHSFLIHTYQIIRYKMTRSLRNIISIAGGTFLGCLGSYTYFQVSSQSQIISPVSVTKSHVSSLGTVAKIYNSTDELLDGSDLVVRGKFTGKPDLSPHRKGIDLPTSASEDQQPPVRDENLIYERDPGHRNLSLLLRKY
jgi:hypothetical protein